MFEVIFDSNTSYKIPSNEIRRNRKIFCSSQKKRDEFINEWFNRIQDQIHRCEFTTCMEILLIDKFFCELSDDEIKPFLDTDTWSLKQLSEYFTSQNTHFDRVKGESDDHDVIDQSTFQAIEKYDEEHVSLQSQNDIACDENWFADQVSDREYDEEEQMIPMAIDSVVVPAKRESVHSDVHDKENKSSNRNRDKEKTTCAKDKLSAEKSTVICDLCGKCLQKRWLNDHRSKIHGVYGKFTCDICKKSTNTLLGMKMHMENTHADTKNSCDLCNESFETRYALNNHVRSFHLDVDPSKPCTCDLCSKTFTTLAKIRTHMSNVHQRHAKRREHFIRPMCHLCGKTFGCRYSLRSHIESVHNKKKFACDLCDSTYSAKSILKRHKETIHLGEKKKIPCELCDKSFDIPSKLKLHMVVHSDAKPHVCEICKASFKRLDHLKTHINYTHLGIESHACKICGKMFKAVGDLKKHTTDIHSGIRKGYACDHCDKAYSQRRNLRMHIKVAHPA